jgi:hypothetical protein
VPVAGNDALGIQLAFDYQPLVIRLDFGLTVLHGQAFLTLYRKLPGPRAFIVGLAAQHTILDRQLMFYPIAVLDIPIRREVLLTSLAGVPLPQAVRHSLFCLAEAR